MKQNSKIAVVYALLAAVFYALNTPISKILLQDVPPTYMAAFLYLGGGRGRGNYVPVPHQSGAEKRAFGQE